jgi:hypothetical protein
LTKEQKEEVCRLYKLNPHKYTGRAKGCKRKQLQEYSLAWIAQKLNLDKHAIYRVIYPYDWIAYRAKRKANLRNYLNDYLVIHPCIDCGETDPVVLEFDHKNPAEKRHNISALIMAGNSIKRLMSEIEKCDVRCSNCHRRRHSKDKSVYKHKRNAE